MHVVLIETPGNPHYRFATSELQANVARQCHRTFLGRERFLLSIRSDCQAAHGDADSYE